LIIKDTNEFQTKSTTLNNYCSNCNINYWTLLLDVSVSNE